MLISVIITTWACEQWVDDCRASVRAAIGALGKANPDWKVEVIEICDGTGVAHARNCALRRAKGEWIVFVDGDDVISPAFLRALAETGGDADLLRFKSASFREGEDWRAKEGVYSFPDAWQATAYRRCVLPECGFRDYRLGDDRLFLLQCLQRAKRPRKVDELVYGYRLHAGSLTHLKVTRERWLDRMAAARTWLIESAKPCANRDAHEREINKAREIVAYETVGVAALELQFLGGVHWDDWRNNLNDVAKLGAILPLVTRVQVAVCRALPWRWVTRLVAEVPCRTLQHFGLR